MLKIFTALCVTFNLFAYSLVAELSSDDISKIDAGEIVLKTKDIKDHPWPEVYLYFKINATPLESVAVFYALEHQKNYIPNLIKSVVTKQPSPLEVHTDYEMKMPWPLSNSKYLHGSKLEYKKDAGYKVNWFKITSTVTDKVDGDAHFINYKGVTLMKYRALVVPKSFFANFVKARMLKDVTLSMEAVRKEVVRLKGKNRKLLSEFVSFIDQSLSGKIYYKK